MFERYSERARRVLFFARYEAAQLGSAYIEPEHVLLGILRENSRVVLRFARDGETTETIGRRLQRSLAPRERISARVEVPFSPSCKQVLAHGAAEADSLENHTIRPEHLVLGIIALPDGAAVQALKDAGIHANAMREHLRGPADDPPEYGAAGVHARLTAHAVSAGVARQWKGVVKPGLATQYLTHLRQETLPALVRLDGFLTATIARRDVHDGTEFQVTTYWRSLDAIKAFAGDDVTRAVVPAAAQALMVRYDERAVHYDVVQ